MWNQKVIAIMLILIMSSLIFTSGFDDSNDDPVNYDMLEVYKMGWIL